VIRRQVRALRRRSNLHVAQHAVALWIAAAATVTAIVIVSAVRGGRAVFGWVTFAGLAALCAATALLARRLYLRWLGARAAPRRIDLDHELRGALPSVLELDGRADDAMFELLVRHNVDALPRWDPRKVVPDVIPVHAAAAAVAAVCLLAVVVVLAPTLRPQPRVVVGDRRMDFTATKESHEGAERLLVTPGTEHPASEREGGSKGNDTREGGADAGGLAGVPASLQDWLQQALGAEEHWESGEPVPSGDTGNVPHAIPQQRRSAAAPVADQGAAGGEGQPADAPRPASQRGGGEGTEPGTGGGGAGAGTDTDPSLFGEPNDEPPPRGDRFELAIAARVRARRGGAMTEWTDAPAPDSDRHPVLAGQNRAEQPGHRMPVPSTFAPLVRRLFAHETTAQGATR
jgi:hypothetical protein